MKHSISGYISTWEWSTAIGEFFQRQLRFAVFYRALAPGGAWQILPQHLALTWSCLRRMNCSV
jgi:hypothetical protein